MTDQTDELNVHIADASRCMYEIRQPVAQSTIEGLIEGTRVLRARLAEYEHQINWHTTCENCKCGADRPVGAVPSGTPEQPEQR